MELTIHFKPRAFSGRPAAAAEPTLFFTFILTLALFFLPACSPSDSPVTLSGPAFGSTWSLRLRSAPEDPAALRDQIQQWLDTFEAELSAWKPDSILSRFNASDSTDWQPISPDFAAVIQHALGASQMTAGAFDITIASPPGHIDYRQLQLRLPTHAIRKLDPALKLDVNAVAPGYAADHIAMMLAHTGAGEYLIDIGGELRARGSWPVGIESPDHTGSPIAAKLTLTDEALCTSGSYRTSKHIDPRTGRIAAHTPELLSVSVIHKSAGAADPLACALMVMGSEKGLSFTAENDIAALFIVRDGAGQKLIPSPAYERRASLRDSR